MAVYGAGYAVGVLWERWLSAAASGSGGVVVAKIVTCCVAGRSSVPIVGSYLAHRNAVVNKAFQQRAGSGCRVFPYSCVHWLRTSRNVIELFPVSHSARQSGFVFARWIAVSEEARE